MIGTHVTKAPTYLHALETARACGFGAVQVFASNPRNGAPVDTSDIRAFIHANPDMHVYIHSAYVCVPWGASPDTSARMLMHDLGVGTRGVVLHLPARVRDVSIFDSLPKTDKLFLEICSTKHPDNYSDPAILRSLPYKICVDTAHLWGLGIDVRTHAIQHWLVAMHDRIALFHLNGAAHSRGSGQDIHAIPFSTKDQIWYDVDYELSGACAIMRYAKKRGIDYIVEYAHIPIPDLKRASLVLFR